ncbi:MAG TPA: ABC transporter permease [Dermatophilaceae bacterium]
MSGVTTTTRPTRMAGVVSSLRGGSRGVRLLLIFGGALLVMSLVRVLTGAQELTSAGTLGAAVALAVPIGLAGLGGLWSERSGVVNIGLEGMMILGTWGAGWAGSTRGVWAGLVVGVAMGAAGGLLHAVATVTFGVDQIISGVAINTLALGTGQFLSRSAFHGQATQSPEIPGMGTFTVPWLPGAMESLETHHWFLVSDLAGIVRAVTEQVPYFTVLAIAMLPLTYVILWRTAFGLRLRSCGEAPYAAETLGVNVYKYKYIAVVVSGALAGFGGAFLAIFSGIYREGQTAGRGFIGLAAMIFGNWRPGGLAAGAGLFGYTDALQARSDEGVHALLLLLALFLAGFGVLLLVRRRYASAGVSLAIAAAAAIWYLRTDTLPQELVYATPYVTTLLVLSVASQRLRMPAADGLIYRRGEGR